MTHMMTLRTGLAPKRWVQKRPVKNAWTEVYIKYKDKDKPTKHWAIHVSWSNPLIEYWFKYEKE